MKCLFFLYGEKRTFETAQKFWNILDIPNLDIIIHTPTTTSEYVGSLDFKKVTENHFDVLGNPKVFLYDRDDYRKTDTHVIHYSWRFLSNYLNNLNIIYDYIFVGRLDSTFYLHDWQNVIKNNSDELYILSDALPETHMADHAFFGRGDIVKKFLNNLPDTLYLHNPHTGLSNYIYKNFKQKTIQNFESSHIRPNMVRYFESYIQKYGKLKNVDDNYILFLKKEFNVKYEYKLDIDYKKQYRVDWIRDFVIENDELENMYLSFLNNLENNKLGSYIEIRGCTNNNSCNYNRHATIDDGSCVD